MLPHATGPSCSVLAVPWLPPLSVLLAVSGCVLVIAGVTDTLPTVGPPLAAARPDSRSHPVEIPTESAHRAAAASVATGQDPAQATAGLVFITAVDWTATDHRSAPTTTQDRIGVDRVAPVLPGSDNRRGFGVLPTCRRSDPARGTRTASAQLATLPLHGDPRHALMQMAAAHDVERGMRSCPCVMMGLTCPGRGQVDSDERIANALFAPALLQSSRSSSGDDHKPTPHVPSEAWDARWNLFEMAAAQRGDWTRQCPCPVYADTPGGGPR
jgi:hypothetical protein